MDKLLVTFYLLIQLGGYFTPSVNKPFSNETVATQQSNDIYQVEQGGGWTKVNGCNDCADNFSTKIKPKQKHIIHIKMFNKQWGQICQKEIEYQP